MKNTTKKALLLAVGGVFVWWAWKAPAQDTTPATASMQMPYAVSQVLELEQAKVGDMTVVAYIRSSGTSYNLNASQIVFLRQQGVSDGVITAMLTQPRMTAPVVTTQAPDPVPQQTVQYAPEATTPAPQYTYVPTTAPAADPTVYSQPPVTYAQPAPAPASYDYSYYYPYSSYNYAYYGWPHFWFPWSVGWGWYGGGWHWGWHGGGWGGGHGGWGGGWHRGGGWHGGGGFHGGHR